MNEINLPIKWNESTDIPGIGLYFVAVRYPIGFGCYDFVIWNGDEWELGYTAEVVGWASIDNVISLINADWPEGDKEIDREFERLYQERKAQKKDADDEDDDFVEVT